MSYRDPTEEDADALVTFHQQRDQHQNRDPENNIRIDTIQDAFEFYLNANEYGKEYSGPYHPLSRDEFHKLSRSKRERLIKEKVGKRIQEHMTTAAKLSQLHSIPLENIRHLDQSAKNIQDLLNNGRERQRILVEF